jgi:hypothetical protein
MSGKTISSAYPTGIMLSDPADNPVTITGSAILGGPGAAFATAGTIGGIPDTIAWTIANYGSVISTGVTTNSYGMLIYGAGSTITNLASGTIAGAIAGIGMSNLGTVLNLGSIAATATAAAGGVVLLAGGAVSNGAGGVISANHIIFGPMAA